MKEFKVFKEISDWKIGIEEYEVFERLLKNPDFGKFREYIETKVLQMAYNVVMGFRDKEEISEIASFGKMWRQIMIRMESLEKVKEKKDA